MNKYQLSIFAFGFGY